MSQPAHGGLNHPGHVVSRVNVVAVFALCCEIASFLILPNADRYFRAALIAFFLVSLISLSCCIRAARYKQRGWLVLPFISVAIPVIPILLILLILATGGIRYGH